MNPICPVCDQELLPGERRISWFNKDEDFNTSERGAIHLKHLMREDD